MVIAGARVFFIWIDLMNGLNIASERVAWTACEGTYMKLQLKWRLK